MFLLRLGHVPGVLRCEDYRDQELASRISTLVVPRLESEIIASSLSVAGLFNYGAQISSPFSPAGDLSNGISSSFPSLNSSSCFFNARDCTDEAQAGLVALNLDHPCQSQFMNLDLPSISSSTWKSKCTHFDEHNTVAYEGQQSENPVSLSDSFLDCSSGMQRKIQMKDTQTDTMTIDDICSYPRAGDDLFDVLGAEFRNQVLSLWDSNEKTANSPEVYPINREESKSGTSTQRQGDYLLETVVSKPHSAKALPVLESSVNDEMFRLPYYRDEESLGIHGSHANRIQDQVIALSFMILGLVEDLI